MAGLVFLVTLLTLLALLSSHDNLVGATSVEISTMGAASTMAEVLHDDPGSRRSLVVNLVRGGLANRVRAIADWYQVATLSKRKLIVSWLPTPDCNATFSRLFDVESMEIDDFRVLPFSLEAGETGIEYVNRMATEVGLTMQSILSEGTQSFVLDDSTESVLRGPSNVVLTSHQGILTLNTTRCTMYASLRSRFLSKLIPAEGTRSILDQMHAQFFKDRLMVGIHIRWHDKRHDWEIVPPMMDGSDNFGGSPKALAFGEGASVADFEAVMLQILAHYPADSVRFLVTSNDADVKKSVLSRFGESVVTINGPLERTSEAGMEFAAVEFFALSRSDLVVHTYGSTFAEESVAIRGVPLVGIWNSARIFAHDARLAHCGHMQFMNLASKQAIPFSYTEGTTDKRSLHHPYYQIFRCPMLSEWGIYDLYCAQHERDQSI